MEKLKDIMLPIPNDSGFKMEGYWVWCGSVIKGDDGKYHMYASRWSKKLPMHPGWLLESEVVHAVADKCTGPYEFSDVVLPQRGEEYWDGKMTHNPHIKKVGDTYVLYYTGSTYPYGYDYDNINYDTPAVVSSRAGKRVGIAYSKSPFGPWTRSDKPILETRENMPDGYLTTNPAPCFAPDGSVVLMYKGRAVVSPEENKYRYSGMKLMIARADNPLGEYTRTETNVVWEDNESEIEYPFLWDDNGFHMIAKDMTGNICGEKYAGIHGFSENGTDWTLEKDSVYYTRQVEFEGNKMVSLGNMERPFILFEDNKPKCAFFAVSDGKNNMGFLNCTETHNLAIPLKTE